MSYHDDSGSGCVNGILFIVFVFFIGFISLKGCISCADEAYRSYDRRERNKTSKEQKNEKFIPNRQNINYQKYEYYHQSKLQNTKSKVVSYQARCPNCNGTGNPCRICDGRRWVMERCKYCNGTGKSRYLTNDGEKLVSVPCACTECNGKGWNEKLCQNCSPLDRCSRCNGHGNIIVVKEISNQ